MLLIQPKKILVLFNLVLFLTTALFLISHFYLPTVKAQGTNRNAPMIIDHLSVGLFDETPIPGQYMDAAKNQFKISYGHTSHGSQIVTGMQMLRTEFGGDYNYTSVNTQTNCGLQPDVFLCDTVPQGDLGNPDRVTWATRTREMLGGYGSNRNMIMWSWCGQADGSEADINTYLNLMNQLEQDYPDVIFIYMTGHLNGTGPSGNLWQRNEQIRNYCRQNNKILFDFADIESYDPAGNFYPQERDTCNWCSTWCTTHSCPTCSSCAHSHCFNCYNKGKAFWVMMARLAGWNPDNTLPTCFQASGHLCAQNQTCPGTWLPVSDSNRCCSVNCQNPAVPNLSLVKQADKTQVQIQEEITYTIGCTNDSQSPALNVIIVDNIPTGASYVSGSADNTGGVYHNAAVTWNLGTMAVGETKNVSFKVKTE